MCRILDILLSPGIRRYPKYGIIFIFYSVVLLNLVMGEKLQRLCQANIFADSVLLNAFYSKIFTDLRFSVGLMPSEMHPARPRL